VAQIEDSGCRSNRKVLRDYPAVADGHLETTENCHPGAEFLVEAKQGGTLAGVHLDEF